MKQKFLILMALAIPLLAACSSKSTASRPIPEPAISSNVQETLAAPSQTEQKASRLALLADKLPEDLTEEFLSWVETAYGSVVTDCLEASLKEGAYEPSLWYHWTGKTLHVLKDQYKGFISDEETARANHIYLQESHNPLSVTLSFAGDISFADGYANMSAYYSRGLEGCLLPGVRQQMAAADIMMINNEFSYSSRGTPLAGKEFTFRAKPSMVQNLQKLSVDLVSTANNHVYDYGPNAFLDTLDTLSAAGIPYVGAGRNLEEAKQAVYFISGGMKIAFVSATQIERTTIYTRGATADTPGVLRTDDPNVYSDAIKTAKANSDFVVVYVHWGTEGTNYFEEDQRTLGRQFIESGADLVIGCHPHVLQGIEYYNGVPIVYSLGNFWFNSKLRETGLVEASFTIDGLDTLKFVPALQKNCRTELVTEPAAKAAALDFMSRLSNGVTIDQEGVITPVIN